MLKSFVIAATVSVFCCAAAATAQNIEAPFGYAQVTTMTVPVIEGDVTDRPSRVIGHIETGIRKATAFSKDSSREKIFRELWERGKKLKADAVIQANYGVARIRAFSWGSSDAQGVAIKFLTDAEIATLPKNSLPLESK